jgi:hypothetical protein
MRLVEAGLRGFEVVPRLLQSGEFHSRSLGWDLFALQRGEVPLGFLQRGGSNTEVCVDAGSFILRGSLRVPVEVGEGGVVRPLRVVQVGGGSCPGRVCIGESAGLVVGVPRQIERVLCKGYLRFEVIDRDVVGVSLKPRLSAFFLASS